jgi:hypothetical protein
MTTSEEKMKSLREEILNLQRIIVESARKVSARNIYIQNLRHPNYTLRRSIPVSLESEENKIIANCYDIDMYGSGDNEEEAIDDLCEVIVEYYESLKADKENLGPLPEKHWDYLRTVVEES